MKEIRNVGDLIKTIQTIEIEREENLSDLKEHFRISYKKINLENIILAI